MAVTSVIEQKIAFISQFGHYDQDAIMANSLIQAFATNSAGGDLLLSYQSYANWDGTQFNYSSIFIVAGFINPEFQPTVQGAIPTLQADFPEYTIVTWGGNIQFGN